MYNKQSITNDIVTLSYFPMQTAVFQFCKWYPLCRYMQLARPRTIPHVWCPAFLIYSCHVKLKYNIYSVLCVCIMSKSIVSFRKW